MRPALFACEARKKIAGNPGYMNHGAAVVDFKYCTTETRLWFWLFSPCLPSPFPIRRTLIGVRLKSTAG
jgi:hypothetical protein